MFHEVGKMLRMTLRLTSPILLAWLSWRIRLVSVDAWAVLASWPIKL
jgi:hypothetical protein